MSGSAQAGNVSLELLAAGHLGSGGDLNSTRLVGPVTYAYGAGLHQISLPVGSIGAYWDVITLFSPDPFTSSPVTGLQPKTVAVGINNSVVFGFMQADGTTPYTGAIDFVMYRIPQQT